MNDRTAIANEVKTATLLAMGHTYQTGPYGERLLIANPERANKWGVVSEADWAVVDAAVEAAVSAPVHTCRREFTRGRYVTAAEAERTYGPGSCGYYESHPVIGPMGRTVR